MGLERTMFRLKTMDWLCGGLAAALNPKLSIKKTRVKHNEGQVQQKTTCHGASIQTRGV